MFVYRSIYCQFVQIGYPSLCAFAFTFVHLNVTVWCVFTFERTAADGAYTPIAKSSRVAPTSLAHCDACFIIFIACEQPTVERLSECIQAPYRIMRSLPARRTTAPVSGHRTPGRESACEACWQLSRCVLSIVECWSAAIGSNRTIRSVVEPCLHIHSQWLAHAYSCVLVCIRTYCDRQHPVCCTVHTHASADITLSTDFTPPFNNIFNNILPLSTVLFENWENKWFQKISL